MPMEYRRAPMAPLAGALHRLEKRQGALAGVTAQLGDGGQRIGQQTQVYASNLDTSQVIGIVVGGILAFIAVFLSIWWCCQAQARKRARAKARAQEHLPSSASGGALAIHNLNDGYVNSSTNLRAVGPKDGFAEPVAPNMAQLSPTTIGTTTNRGSVFFQPQQGGNQASSGFGQSRWDAQQGAWVGLDRYEVDLSTEHGRLAAARMEQERQMSLASGTTMRHEGDYNVAKTVGTDGFGYGVEDKPPVTPAQEYARANAQALKKDKATPFHSGYAM